MKEPFWIQFKQCVVVGLLVCLLSCLMYFAVAVLAPNTQRPPVAYKPSPATTSAPNSKYMVTNVVRRHVITRPSAGGRLGNKMFLYASLLGIAAMNNMIPIYHGIGSIIDQTFENLTAIKNAIGFNKKARSATQIIEYSNWIYDNRFERLYTVQTSDVTVLQFLQSWKYFHRIPAEIRRAFSFRREYVESAERFLLESSASIRSSKRRPVFVGVHIRRTDWIKLMPKRDVGGQTYLLKAVKILNDKLSLTQPDRCLIYVVCSDDQTWARANFLSVVNSVTAFSLRHGSGNKTTLSESSPPTCEPKVVHSRGRSASEDMALLAACNHTIITVGTYGWWGAWLAGGITIAFSKYPPFSNQLTVNLEDYYPPNWITIS